LFQPFPSLEILSFQETQEWEEWNLIKGAFVKFPILKRLFLCDYLKLKWNLPNNLPLLPELELSQCPMLNSQHHPDDMVNNGNLTRLLMTLSLYSLTQLTITGIPSLVSFPENILPTTLHYLTFLFLPESPIPILWILTMLHITGEFAYIQQMWLMTSFPLSHSPVLKSLFILGCKNLKHISVMQCSSWQSLLCLESLSIYACLKLETVPDSGSLVTPNLNNFLVSTCGKLKSLPKPINALSRLYQMSVYGISNLLAFVEGGFPVHLRTLEIS